MSVLDTFTQLRSHLERCRILLDTLAAEEMPREVEEHIAAMQESVRTTIIRNIKSVVNYKNDKKIPITSTFPVAAEVIKESVGYSGDLEVADAAEEECKRKTAVIISAKRTPVRYHIDPMLNKLVQAYCEMGGVSLHKLIKPFKLDPPKLEMIDLLTFIQEIKTIREQKGMYSDCAVYAHLCNYSAIYVGIARIEFRGQTFPDLRSAIESRLNEHRNWPSNAVKANWTALNKVITCMFYLPGDKEDENLITQLLTHCVGEEKVRGGDHTFIGPYDFPLSTVFDIKYKLLKRS